MRDLYVLNTRESCFLIFLSPVRTLRSGAVCRLTQFDTVMSVMTKAILKCLFLSDTVYMCCANNFDCG